MTFAQIFGRTPQNRKDKAAYVTVKEAKVQRTAYGTVIYKAKLHSTNEADGTPKKGQRNQYVATIETNDKQVVVSCSCLDFTYRWEYPLHMRKAARLEYSNGEKTRETNPGMIPGCCCHLVKLGNVLVKKGKIK